MIYSARVTKTVFAAAAGVFGLCITSAHAWQSDNGDGTFTNPPLYADYPDPDIIRVGGDFYFSTTTIVNVPGITILHLKDLVIIGGTEKIKTAVNQRSDKDFSLSDFFSIIESDCWSSATMNPQWKCANGNSGTLL